MNNIESKDYIEPNCCFDAGMENLPDGRATGRTVPVPQIIARLDGLFDRGLEADAKSFLNTWRCCARAMGDWRGELSLLSELMGLHRRTGDKKSAMQAVDDGMELIKTHALCSTVSGATIMLNAATTMKAFGRAGDSLPVFQQVCRVYGEKLDPLDYRFGGLYNNMALSYADLGDTAAAEKYFQRAMAVIRTCQNPENELAVTECNMAHMYDRADGEDERIGQCMERAWAYLDSPHLPRDGYYAFTASKCAPAFDYFGYFIYAGELKERAEKIYAGNR